MNSKPISLGIVGLGRATQSMHLKELEGRESKFRIVAACDVIEDRRAMMTEHYGCPAYEKIEDLIADPQVEMVDIVTRSPDHFAHAKMALEAGKYVFLEKPMCTNYKDALALSKIAESTGNRLYIRHNRRFEPAFTHIREIISSGILGDVYQIKLQRAQYMRRGDWQTIKECGGGMLLNWGPHIIDHSLRLLESPVKSMFSDLKRVAAIGNAEDHIKIVFMGENGRMVDMEICFGAALSQDVYMIWGTRGALSSDEKTIKLRYIDPNQQLSDKFANPGTPNIGDYCLPEKLEWIEESIPVDPQLKVDMTSIWDYLYSTVREGKPFPITIDEALGVIKVISEVKAGTEFSG
ncbi:Gfo/Idh/MocA family oxidoreductase [bacterium]|nr:Gfo/Idh/MocA family oxidoreductase [bacterium]